MKIARFDIGYAIGVALMAIYLEFELPFWAMVVVGIVGYAIGNAIARQLSE